MLLGDIEQRAKYEKQEPQPPKQGPEEDRIDNVLMYEGLLRELDYLVKPEFWSSLDAKQVLKYVELRLAIAKEWYQLQKMDFDYKLQEAKQDEQVKFKQRRYVQSC